MLSKQKVERGPKAFRQRLERGQGRQESSLRGGPGGSPRKVQERVWERAREGIREGDWGASTRVATFPPFNLQIPVRTPVTFLE